jgi:regulator of cell morphogenesis and NO signaling
MLDPNQTVAQIVLDHSATAAVFQQNKIDFCCRGDQSLAEACARRTLDVETIRRQLEEAIASRTGSDLDPRALSTADLTRFIVGKHHDYLRRTLPVVRGLATKVARVHGEREPRLRDLERVVLELDETLIPHLDDEERHLFPAMAAPEPDLAGLAPQLATMQAEHVAVGALLAEMRALADEYAPPDWACRSFRALFSELSALETDTLHHVALENHVLAPRFPQG